MKPYLQNIKAHIERYIPMTFGNLLLFAFLIYLIIVVGQSVITNYNSNKIIDEERGDLTGLNSQIKDLENSINYYQTASFREKEAREKLGYRTPGEKVIALPIDTEEDKMADTGLTDVSIKTPNYRLWWQYFFGSKSS